MFFICKLDGWQKNKHITKKTWIWRTGNGELSIQTLVINFLYAGNGNNPGILCLDLYLVFQWLLSHLVAWFTVSILFYFYLILIFLTIYFCIFFELLYYLLLTFWRETFFKYFNLHIRLHVYLKEIPTHKNTALAG